MPAKKIHIATITPIQKNYLSAREAKAYLGCEDEYLQKLRDIAKVSFSRDGNKIWYELASIDRFLEKNKVI